MDTPPLSQSVDRGPRIVTIPIEAIFDGDRLRDIDPAYLVLYRTSVGLVVRAGIENAGMVGILGIDVRRTFLFVFAVGIVAVGLAGMLYAPVVAVTPDMGASFMVQSFVVIVLGGLGSFPGAIVGGLIAGEIISLTSAFNSAYSEVMLYGLMALVLVARPQGLFGTEGRV